jgi:predicted transcriptional regulator of viral defense system
LALVSSKNNQQFSMEAATQFWGSSAMAKKKLYRLEKKGWVARIERGKYIVIPLEAGPERKKYLLFS